MFGLQDARGCIDQIAARGEKILSPGVDGRPAFEGAGRMIFTVGIIAPMQPMPHGFVETDVFVLGENLFGGVDELRHVTFHFVSRLPFGASRRPICAGQQTLSS